MKQRYKYVSFRRLPVGMELRNLVGRVVLNPVDRIEDVGTYLLWSRRGAFVVRPA